MPSNVQHALLVGASRGIVLGLADQLLQQMPEMELFATARNPGTASDLRDLAQKHDNRMHVLQLDMNLEDSIASAAEAIRQTTTVLSQVWINGGVLGTALIPMQQWAADDLRRALETNVIGSHLVAKTFLPFLLANDNTSNRFLAFMTSAVGSFAMVRVVAERLGGLKQTPFHPAPGYAVSKAATVMLAKQYALLYEPQGLPVIALHPGTVRTDMLPEAPLSVKESTTGLVKAALAYKIGDGDKGLTAWDGSFVPL